MKPLFYIIGLWGALSLNGCATMKPAPGPGGAAPAASPPAGGWAYDAFISWTPAMGLADKGDLCPNGISNEEFWPALFKATAYMESGWKPGTTYTEKFADDHGVKQVSRGLMQLSYDDEGRGPHCSNLMVTITDPESNLRCASDIMNQLVKANVKGSLRANLGRYWSTIRDGKVDPLLREYLPGCFGKVGK